MRTDTDTLVDLLTDAYDLLQRHVVGSGHARAAAEAALLRDELRERSATAPGGDVTEDLEAVAAELDDFLARVQDLREPQPALTG